MKKVMRVYLKTVCLSARFNSSCGDGTRPQLTAPLTFSIVRPNQSFFREIFVIYFEIPTETYKFTIWKKLQIS